MNTVRMPLAGDGLPMQRAEVDTGRGDAFSRHQTWLREFEKALQAQGAARGDPGGQGPRAMAKEASDAASPLISMPALTWDASGVAPAARVAMPQHPSFMDGADAIDAPWAAPVPMPAPRAHAASGPPPPPEARTGQAADSGRHAPVEAGAAEPPAGIAAADILRARLATAGQGYAERVAQVFRRGDRLTLVLRDAHLPVERCEDILKALIGHGLPPGIREISVTLNGHTRATYSQTKEPEHGD